MTSSADALAAVIGDRTDPSNLDLFTGTVVSIGSTGIRVDSAGRQLLCTTLLAVAAGDAVWVAQVGGRNVILGREEKRGRLSAETTVTTNASGDWTVTLPTSARVVAALAMGAQPSFPHLHVRNTGTYPTAGNVAGWRAFNVPAMSTVASSLIGVVFIIEYDYA